MIEIRVRGCFVSLSEDFNASQKNNGYHGCIDAN